jgi:sugar phosphate isomerase/epimerase
MGAMQVGVLVPLQENPEESIRTVQDLGFPTCQVSCWDPERVTVEMAQALRRAADAAAIEITTLWVGTPGRRVWNFVEGPSTIGLVPLETRAQRLAALKHGADVASWAGVSSITTHVGFIPENPGDPNYPPLIEALRDLGAYCRAKGLGFWFETGQETPVTLLRTIQDLGLPNLGINLDPANLLMYGKANPVDALDVFGAYVRGVHAKDGEYPTNGRDLGQEKPLGQGRVDFPRLIGALKALDYSGALTIEREISGAQQRADILAGKEFLENLIRQG